MPGETGVAGMAGMAAPAEGEPFGRAGGTGETAQQRRMQAPRVTGTSQQRGGGSLPVPVWARELVLRRGAARGIAGMPLSGRGGGGRMRAAVGDRLRVHASGVGRPGRTGEIVEVRGAGGEPPYLVRFADGHTALMFPGPDAIIEHPRKKGRKGPAKG